MLKPNSKIWALVDCNNFFVSCERIFNPKLIGKPTVVLSNNDGCIVSRSQEAKDLKIPMGAPVFKISDLLKKHNVNVLSANFSLYGDISNRVMNILQMTLPVVEIYSIDEAFLDLSSIKFPFNIRIYEKTILVHSYTELCSELLKIIKKYIGIPVSFGIATTKTLCKIANEVAKYRREFNSVTSLLNLDRLELDTIFKKFDVNDVWGLGSRLSKKLNANGIYKIYDFIQTDSRKVKSLTKIQGLRTQMELQGISCIQEQYISTKRSIASTRSFGMAIKSIGELREAVSEYCTIAARKLRKQNAVAGFVSVFLVANKFGGANFLGNSANVKMYPPTNYTGDIIKYAIKGLESIFQEDIKYQKAGVILYDIFEESKMINDLFDSNINFDKKKEISSAIDSMNTKWGRDILIPASTGFEKKWKAKSEFRSKLFTSKWQELLEVG